MAEAVVSRTPIPGLLVVDLPVHRDNRGWFKENWQRAKMVASGLPDFQPVQNNVSFNERAGATRGIHAEPWDKYVSVATGRVFGAWVDLRQGPTFGAVFSTELGPDKAVFVPRGVGNAFQTLTDATAYSYLVNEHWSAEAKSSYAFVNLADPQLGISWPIALDQAELSEADQNHPQLSAVRPVAARRTLILGANGQVGTALRALLPDADSADRSAVDLTRLETLDKINWADYDTVVNAAAYTAVDVAETPQGRRDAWAVNVTAVGRLAEIARRHRLLLVHLSSDYVFDGEQELHTEDEAPSPLGVYGQTKAAGDALVAALPQHYILRTSWVVGDGRNFVRTMADLAARGVRPAVIDDQLGRLTFADDIARGVAHLLRNRPATGTYNLTSAGRSMSWADIAELVYRHRGRSEADVQRVSTETYGEGRQLAPRPRHSVLDLAKIIEVGFKPADGESALQTYLDSLPTTSETKDGSKN
ncbi:bifunctional dTDP-4-dehydrorhamnose 3,5-epimerase family protein/NAD(P)-dependent oxidoreductase [Microlunatus panaciterrae]|uniref:dTDP-4-dehydrorhamnose reductase n=1 Tax=Microlunatus panaciterrae TaxID=400768 RepID=A0ABS2RKF9_9ACTN|nr:dTDP-4-dehydrorhamnose 3,5-epimerase [Microlunatus panaciterrae]